MKRLSLPAWLPVLFIVWMPMSAAAWSIDPSQSQISYLSSKLVAQSHQTIVEDNVFESFSGSVSADGEVRLSIDADSVNTGVEIRDERVRLHAFDTKNHPQLVFTAKLDKSVDSLQVGEVVVQELPGTLKMRGIENKLTVHLVVVRNAEDTVLVQTLRPLLVNAADYEMTEGFEQLRALVSLFNIPQIIPVSVKLVLKK